MYRLRDGPLEWQEPELETGVEDWPGGPARGTNSSGPCSAVPRLDSSGACSAVLRRDSSGATPATPWCGARRPW